MMEENYRKSLVNNYLKEIELNQKIKEYFFGRTILVTGGAGAIGSSLVITLSKLVGKEE